MNESITLFQSFTLGLAVLGAVLGVINTWHGLSKSRVKLKVTPAHAIPMGASNSRINFCIEVTNLSDFAVTVYDVGILYKDTSSQGAITQPIFLDGGRWPRRLDPRSAVTVYAQLPDDEHRSRIKCAYAKTECGHVQKGTSPALRQIARQ